METGARDRQSNGQRKWQGQGQHYGRRKDGYHQGGNRRGFKPNYRDGRYQMSGQSNEPTSKFGFKNPVPDSLPEDDALQGRSRNETNGATQDVEFDDWSTEGVDPVLPKSNYIFDPFFEDKSFQEEEEFKFEPAKTKVHLSDERLRKRLDKTGSSISNYDSDDILLTSIDCRRLHGLNSDCQFCDGKTGRWSKIMNEARTVRRFRFGGFDDYQDSIKASMEMKESYKQDGMTKVVMGDLELAFAERLALN